MIRRLAHRLDDKNVGSPDILFELDAGLAIAPLTDDCSAKRRLQLAHDVRGQLWMRIAGEHLQPAVHHVIPCSPSLELALGAQELPQRARQPKRPS